MLNILMSMIKSFLQVKYGYFFKLNRISFMKGAHSVNI